MLTVRLIAEKCPPLSLLQYFLTYHTTEKDDGSQQSDGWELLLLALLTAWLVWSSRWDSMQRRKKEIKEGKENVRGKQELKKTQKWQGDEREKLKMSIWRFYNRGWCKATFLSINEKSVKLHISRLNCLWAITDEIKMFKNYWAK